MVGTTPLTRCETSFFFLLPPLFPTPSVANGGAPSCLYHARPGHDNVSGVMYGGVELNEIFISFNREIYTATYR